MPFDGSGNFNRVMDWTNDAAAAIKIRADRHDQNDDDIAAGLSNTITKDGQSQPTANIPMNGKKLINLGAPTNPTDAASKTYVDTADALKANIASPTFTGKVTLPTGAAGSAPLSFPNATAAPTTPANGDIWPDATNLGLKHRINGVTYTYGRLEAAQTWTAQQTHTGVTGNSAMNVATSGLGEIMVLGNGTGAAMAAFHRPGAFAAYFGIDTDNKWKVGGWSMGAGSYEILHVGNYAAILDARYIENSADNLSLGAAGFAMATFANDGTKSSGTYTPTAAGGNFRYVVNGGAFTFAADPDNSKAYTLVILLVNSATAGAVTFSGYNVYGDPLNTVNAANFMCTIVHFGGVRTITIQQL